MIANHIAPSLSDLDMKVVHSVPPGGNWKDIPLSVPSSRLEQIRVSYAAGEGSRSTYYGRLRLDAPSYTINTYFTRPGNGCHIHPTQDRVLTYREAARLQSFPDSFAFSGSNGRVATQIGNAVPPLLAFQVALRLGDPGDFVDLFAGAGGLSLGFLWAGWRPIVGSDLESPFLDTYRRNIHDAVIPGDFRSPQVFDEVVRRAIAAESSRLWVVGGPPCQGFSTAGNLRSMVDERNHLFRDYRRFLDEVKPAGFVFENVPGIMNMEGGRVFEMVKETLRPAVDQLAIWRLRAERFAVPQRRERVFIVGWNGQHELLPPRPVTADPRHRDAGEVFPWVSVEEALADLPPLEPGQDGSGLEYVGVTPGPYQSLMRGEISAAKYLATRAPAVEELVLL